ncbi:hypothetical protein AB5J62_07210 [Amycolatopsis sp. cg5]|uniref:hypothetical protein n=1 Tax=Amycolatopsis sp. cg5 TaxID=3238802 RepID=UPI00352620A8
MTTHIRPSARYALSANPLWIFAARIRHTLDQETRVTGGADARVRRPAQTPAHLAVSTRQESSSLRLAALYDPGFVPKSYVDDLLRRMRAVVVACGRDGGLAPGVVVKADHWLETLRMVRV